MMVDDALDAFLEGGRAVVDQEPEGKAHQPEIGEQLLMVDGGQLLDGFELNHQDSIDHQVRPKSFVQAESIKFNRHGLLARDRPTAILQPLGQNRLVNRLEQPRPQVAVQMKGGVNDDRGKVLDV